MHAYFHSSGERANLQNVCILSCTSIVADKVDNSSGNDSRDMTQAKQFRVALTFLLDLVTKQFSLF